MGSNNAPRGLLVSKGFHGIFSDPDDDELTYAVSVPADQTQLVEVLEVTLDKDVRKPEQTWPPVGTYDRVCFRAEAETDWKAITPPLPDRPVVTLTATDPEGLSASLEGDFLVWWESYPEVVSAVTSGQSIELTFDWAVQENPAPTPEQFTVNVVNEDGSAGTISVSRVSVNGKVVRLELVSALESGQTVTLDYDYHDDVPLQRVSGGAAAPGFTGQEVEFLRLPGEPQNFAVSAEAGELVLAATWDSLDGATSYNLRWR